MQRDERFAEFAWRVTQDTGVVDTLAHIVGFACSSVGADEAGITLIGAGGELASVGQSDDLVTRCDALQQELGQGPCIDAAREARHVAATDLSADRRWPVWSKYATDLGMHSILSTTMYTAGRRRLGSLNLYGRRPRQFDAEQMETARLFAAHATAALWSAIHEHNLENALESRTEIGQATGVLMEKYDLTSDQAFAVLQRYSQDSNTKLRQIAETVVEQRALPHAAADHQADHD